MNFKPQDFKIGIIGLGYVGLPLAVQFGKKYDVVGFDLKTKRIDELKNAIDVTLETTTEDLQLVKSLKYTSNFEELSDCNIFIVTVPTPIDKHKQPNLMPLKSATKTIGKILKKDDIVIYESTVYPGCTEEVCVPILEEESGLKYNSDFYCGYSPERINPGDKKHTVTTIQKIVSGSTYETLEKIDELYRSIITAGTYKATSIKVAEAAKVIENTQRDINIAFVNELAIIFEKLGIDTKEVLEAAGTKWNFLPFQPGLVGGHCIGVDPYYLTHKAQEVGFNPEIILSGRRLNDNMGAYVAEQTIKGMIKKGHQIYGANVLVLGITFKENCPDIRNSKVIDVILAVKSFGCKVDVYDSWANKEEVSHEYGIELVEDLHNKVYEGIILAVGHKSFNEIDFSKLKDNKSYIYDVKGFLPSKIVDKRL